LSGLTQSKAKRGLNYHGGGEKPPSQTGTSKRPIVPPHDHRSPGPRNRATMHRGTRNSGKKKRSPGKSKGMGQTGPGQKSQPTLPPSHRQLFTRTPRKGKIPRATGKKKGSPQSPTKKTGMEKKKQKDAASSSPACTRRVGFRKMGEMSAGTQKNDPKSPR